MDSLFKYETTSTDEHNLCDALNNGLIFSRYDSYSEFDDSHFFNNSVLLSYKTAEARSKLLER